MPAVFSTDQIVHEDLSDMYINIDVRQTPLLSRIKTDEPLINAELFSWATERYEDGRDNTLVSGIPEGQDVTVFETDVQTRLYGRPQMFRRTPMVTVQANEVNKAPADFGKYIKQVNKKMEEQKRNIEKRLLSDGDSQDDNGTVGREFMAAGRFVNDTVSVGSSGAALTFGDSQTAVPATLLTPTAQIYVGNLDALDGSGNNRTLIFAENDLNIMLQSRYDAFGMTDELSGFVDPVLKRHLTKLERYQPNLVGFTPITRTPNEAIAAKNYLLFGADLLETDFGPIDINLVSWMPRTSTGAISGRGYFLDMTHIGMRKCGVYLRHTQLQDEGGGPRGYIQSLLGPRWGHPGAHLKIDPNVVTGTYT
jgi:hypothetical protein